MIGTKHWDFGCGWDNIRCNGCLGLNVQMHIAMEEVMRNFNNVNYDLDEHVSLNMEFTRPTRVLVLMFSQLLCCSTVQSI